MEVTILPLTCTTCHVQYKDPDIFKQHYKSDWHRYNLKRKVAEMPPLTAEEFQRRVIVQHSKESEQSQRTKNLYCKICRKRFNTNKQYDNHLDSKKHKQNSVEYKNKEKYLSNAEVTSKEAVSNKEEETDDIEFDSEVESIDSDEWLKDTENPVENNDCLFCNHHSKSVRQNLKHMSTVHSFFIADPEYCIDIKGLLIYLGEKIFAGYKCIWCNDSGRQFQDAEAARMHMLDKGHCKMLHEGEALAEYMDFYDYSSSYPDANNDVNVDEEVELPSELDDNDFQLVLPSGNVIGHRSLMRYYKQNPNRTVVVRQNEKLQRILMKYRGIGWTSIQLEKDIAVKKARDIKYMQRVQAKYSTQLQFKANKLQRHFRQQVNF